MVIFNCYVWLEGFCGHFHPCLACFDVIPSGKLSHNYRKSMKITIFHEIPISHEKWWFSIVMTVYQRVTCSFFRCPNSPQGASDRRGHGPTRQRGPDASKPGLGGGHRAAEPEGAGAAGGVALLGALGILGKRCGLSMVIPAYQICIHPQISATKWGGLGLQYRLPARIFLYKQEGLCPPFCIWNHVVVDSFQIIIFIL